MEKLRRRVPRKNITDEGDGQNWSRKMTRRRKETKKKERGGKGEKIGKKRMKKSRGGEKKE